MMQQIFIDGQLADLSEDTNVTLRYESNILTGASSFTCNHSLTVALPATAHNSRLFGLPTVVQSNVGEVYRWHDVDYIRDGVPVVSGGRCRVLKASPDKIEITMFWGIKRAVDTIFGSESMLSDIETDASIEFHAEPQLTPYAVAVASSTEVFYAAMDTVRYASELSYYRMHVSFANRSWDTNSVASASAYLHPSVRMDWLLDKIQEANNITLDFDDPNGEISTMIVPLVSKIPNDITFNGGYRATVSEPFQANNNIRFTTANASPIIEPQQSAQETSLRCAQAFKGLLRFSMYLYVNDLVLLSYPIMRVKYGYRLDVTTNAKTESCVIIPEGTMFMAYEADNQGRIGFTITGSVPIEMEVGDTLSLRLTCINGGVANPDLYGGIHVNGGNVWINDIIGDLNEVQPTQQYPVQGNLPEVKTIDLVKFLCAVTGAFPVQASTDDVLQFRQVEAVFNWNRAEDWSGRLLSPSDRPEPTGVEYTPNRWAKRNWWRWKEDDTVSGNYDGAIIVDDETIDDERTVMTFPFAATDGNNVPMYSAEYRNGITATKWNKVEPRVLHIQEDSDGNASAFFGFDMSQVIGLYYYDLASTMEKPVVITETFRMTDIQFTSLDETRPIFLAQYGAYFAMLSCELSQNGTAKVELLKLKKQEEI